jgi:hypothetical protein
MESELHHAHGAVDQDHALTRARYGQPPLLRLFSDDFIAVDVVCSAPLSMSSGIYLFGMTCASSLWRSE